MALSKQLADQRAPLVLEMRQMVEHAAKEDRGLNNEEREKFDKIDADQKSLQTRIEEALTLERALDIEQPEERTPAPSLQQPKPHVPAEGRIDMAKALRSWLLAPTGRVSNDDLELAARAGYSPFSKQIDINLRRVDERGNPIAAPRNVWEAQKRLEHVQELRVQQGLQTSTTAGGYTVPDEMMAAIDVALLQWGGMRQVSTVLSTSTGADLPIPTVNDTSNSGEIVDETTAASGQDVAFGQVVMKSWKYSSKLIQVSMELLQDSSTNIPVLLGDLLGTRIGRITNLHFTTGDNSGKPNGIIGATAAAADSGVTAAGAASLTFSELLQLKHSVNPAYRGPGSGFMGNDTTLRIMKEISDSTGRPIWMPGLVAGEPDLFDGHPFGVNQDMPNGTGTKAVIFGQLSKYHIREVLGITLIRLVERYAEYGHTAFVAWGRFDGRLVDAGTNPVKYLDMG